MYKIRLIKPFFKFYSKCKPSVVKKINRTFSILKSEPHEHNNITKLTGDFLGLWRFRIGVYRIIYEIDDPTESSDNKQFKIFER